MTRLFTKYPYIDYPSAGAACLYNLRDDDFSAPGSIGKGEITIGKCGFAVAENAVSLFSAPILEYSPNRCVKWQGYFLTCMALDGLPIAPLLKGGASKLRHKHYVVAELPSPKIVAHARMIGLPVILSADGRSLVNLEIFTVPGKTPPFRRAKLL